MKKNIRWGILGLGKIAHKFVSDLKTVPHSILQGVASSNMERGEEFAKLFGAKACYLSYEALCESPDVDVIYVASLNHLHYEHTLLALKSGKSVLCEKPFALNSEQVADMIALAKQQNVFLMEAMWNRFMPTWLAAKKWVEEGKIGQIRLLEANFGICQASSKRQFQAEWGGGALYDIGIYPVFFSLFFLGKPNTIQAVANIGKTGVDESMSIALGFENAVASLHTSIVSTTNCEAAIYGSEGSIVFKSRFHEGKRVQISRNDQQTQTLHFNRKKYGYCYEIEEVNECLRTGKKESNKMPLSLSQTLIETLDLIRSKI